MQNSLTNTFLKGMNLDTAKEFVGTELYIDALNVHVVTTDGGTSGALQPYADLKTIANKISGTVLGTTVGHIQWNNDKTECFIVLHYEDELYKLSVYSLNESNDFYERVKIIETKTFGFKINERVKLINIWENSEVSRVYMCGKDSYIQAVNINHDYGEKSDTENYDFSIFPKCGALPPFVFSAITDGYKRACKVLYAYLLFDTNGRTTALSAVSHMITIGSELQDDLTDEGVVIAIPVSDSVHDFTHIRIYEIVYTNYSDIPRIYIKDEALFDIVSGHYTYVDKTDVRLSEITLEEFQSIKSSVFAASTIETKNNRLFAADITEHTFDVEFDARVYSADAAGMVDIDGNAVALLDIVDGKVVIQDKFVFNNPDTNVYKYNTAFGKTLTTVNQSSTYEDYVDYPCGGAGPNISYMFTRPLLYLAPNVNIHEDNGVRFVSRDLTQNKYGLATGVKVLCEELLGDFQNASYIEKDSNVSHVISDVTYADPYICANYTGFKQGESYTFGIVFYNDRNIASPVHFIGTITIPYFNNWIFSAVEKNESTQHDLVAATVGIRFRVVLPKTSVKAYEIVRVLKTPNTRKVLMQGIASNTATYTQRQGKYGVDSLGENDLRNTMYPTISKTFYSMFKYSNNDRELGVLLTESNYATFVSPEISTNKENSQQSLDISAYLHPVKMLSSVLHQQDLWKSLQSPLGNVPVFKHIAYATSSSKIKVGDDEFVDYSKFAGVPIGRVSIDGYELAYEYMGISNSTDEDGSKIGHSLYKYYTPSNYSGTVSQKLDIQYIKFAAAPSSDNLDKGLALQTIIGDKVFVNVTTQDNDNSNSDDNKKDRSGIHCNCAIIKFENSRNLYAYESNPILMSMNWSELDNYLSFVSIDPLSKSGATKTDYDYVYDGNKFAWDDLFDQTVWKTTRNTAVLADLCTNYTPYIQYSQVSNLLFTSTGQYAVCDTNATVGYINCFGGDTYVCIHKELWSGYGYGEYKENVAQGRNSIHIKYPVETRINLDRVAGPNFDSNPDNPYFTFEPALLLDKGAQELPLNAYNDAYSAQEYNKVFVTKGMYDIADQRVGNRIVASEVKSTGELSDSFLNFKIANYIDVDALYGNITNLVKYNNRLYYLQSTAFGTVAVNERSLITDNNQAALLLGTGDVLARYDNISTFDGSDIVNDPSILVSPSSLYWYDSNKKSLCVFNEGGLNSLSKVKQAQSYFNSLNKDHVVHSGYDTKNNEAWFHPEGESRSIIYSEQVQAFTGFYTIPVKFAQVASEFSIGTNGNNFVQFGKKSDQKLADCYVKFVVNKEPAIPKVYDSMMLSDCYTPAFSNSVIPFNVACATNRQGSVSEQYPNSVTNREGVYYISMGRDLNKERMRDKTMTVLLTFEDTNFNVPFVNTIYRYSRI